MSTAKITRTTALYPSRVFLQWDVQCDESGDFYIDVQRSGSPTGPWESIAVALKDAYNFVDQAFGQPPIIPPNGEHWPVNLFSLSRAIYYRVAVTPPSGVVNMFSSDPMPVEPGLDTRTRLLKRKLLRDLSVGFRKLNGVPLAVLKRKRWGERCPVCFDETLRESTQEHCPTCFGTSFRGGYWTPVQIRGRREVAPVQTRLESGGETDIQLPDFIVLDYPRLEYKDIIVNLTTNERYEVQRVTPTELKGVTVHQKLASSLLSHSSVEYKVPVEPLSTPPLY